MMGGGALPAAYGPIESQKQICFEGQQSQCRSWLNCLLVSLCAAAIECYACEATKPDW